MTRDNGHEDTYTLEDLNRDTELLENNQDAARNILSSDDPVETLQDEAASYERGLSRHSPGAEEYMDDLEEAGL